ncbi:ribonuclease H-like domain-containing protein, partial [Tanacetum coccineum]
CRILGQGILDPASAIYSSQPTTLPSAFSIMPPQDPTWHMDTRASSHLNFNVSNLSTVFDKRLFPSVHVGDDKSILVTNTGHSIIPSHHRPLHLHNVLVTPKIIKNLIYVRQFTRDNNCTIEFNAFGFSVKDYLTRHILLRCDSSGDLYPVTKPSTSPIAFLSTSTSTWHQRLGHPGDQSDALKDPQWRNVMYDEYNALVKNGTWLLVPRPGDVNMVRSMWLFKHKFHADGTLSRYKARLVANGSSQQLGVDFDETFSPVVKPATIRTVLSLAVSRKWPIHQLDVKNAFLNGDLSETVYMHQPPGFVDARQGSQVAYLLIYVDDIILTASSPALLQQIIDSLHNEFDMTDLGALNYFLGISADRNSTGLFLSQRKYDSFRLLSVSLFISQSCRGLQYLTFTRPDLSYAVQQLYAFATTSLVGYTDTNLAGCPSTRSEYRGVANVVTETAWLRNLLCELHSPLSTVTLVYCDNVRVLHVPSRFQYADIFTKGLPSALFEEFRSSLSVRPLPAPTAGAY